MPRKQHNELTAGLFVVAGVVVLLGVVLWLGAADLLRAEGQVVTFSVAMADGSLGIREGADVTLGDARVGRVVGVAADPNAGRCTYTAQLERGDLAVHSDANAEATTPMVGQARIVLLSLGTPGKPLAGPAAPIELLPGGFERTLRDVTHFAEGLEAQLDLADPNSLMAKVHGVANNAGDAARELAMAVSAVKAEFSRDDRESLLGKVHQGISDLNLAAEHLREQMNADEPNAVLGGIRRAVAHVVRETDAQQKGTIFRLLRDAVGGVEALVQNSRPVVASILLHLDGTAEEVERLTREDVAEVLHGLCEAKAIILHVLDDVRDASQDVKEVVRLNRDNIDETIDNITQASETLKAALKEIRRSPWRLVHEPTDDERESQDLFDAAKAFVDGASELDQAVAKLRAVQKMRLNEDPAAKATAEKVLRGLEKSFEDFSKAEKLLWQKLKAAKQ